MDGGGDRYDLANAPVRAAAVRALVSTPAQELAARREELQQSEECCSLLREQRPGKLRASVEDPANLLEGQARRARRGLSSPRQVPGGARRSLRLFLAHRKSTPGTEPPLRRVGVLSLGLAVHACFVLVYLALMVAIGAVSSQIFPTNLDAAAFTWGFSLAWLFFVCGGIWLIVLVNLIRWSRQGRTGLVSSTVAWDLLLWLGPFVLFLVRWDRARTLLVPSPAPDSGTWSSIRVASPTSRRCDLKAF
jgi:hypothetical protein